MADMAMRGEGRGAVEFSPPGFNSECKRVNKLSE